jgi:alpha-galactosidase
MRPALRRWVTGLGAAVLAAVAVAVPADQLGVLDNGLGRTPAMGWNSWNTFGCDIDEALIRSTADALVATGLRDRGYRYVVVDDCWFDPHRDAAGDLRGDPARFPSGMRALGDYLHARGLKFGLYETPAGRTCGQYVGLYPGSTGSKGHEAADARRFAAWGVDYLKYDWCSPDGSVGDQVAGFARMRDALAATGRPILYSVNPNSLHTTTGPERDWGDVANQWRSTQDITATWASVRDIAGTTVPLAGYPGPGSYADPDMLEVGRPGLTAAESRSHFALWAMMAAPLIAGNDVRRADPATLAVLGNLGLIAVDQDPLGRPATEVARGADQWVLARPLANGDTAIALINEAGSTATVRTTAAAAGRTGSSFTLRDVWTGATTTTTGPISASVPAHGTAVFRISGGVPANRRM